MLEAQTITKSIIVLRVSKGALNSCSRHRKYIPWLWRAESFHSSFVSSLLTSAGVVKTHGTCGHNNEVAVLLRV